MLGSKPLCTVYMSSTMIQTKSGLSLGSIGNIMFSKLFYKYETANAIWMLCLMTAFRDHLDANKYLLTPV